MAAAMNMTSRISEVAAAIAILVIRGSPPFQGRMGSAGGAEVAGDTRAEDVGSTPGYIRR
jgi:hypothetical protein